MKLHTDAELLAISRVYIAPSIYCDCLFERDRLFWGFRAILRLVLSNCESIVQNFPIACEPPVDGSKKFNLHCVMCFLEETSYLFSKNFVGRYYFSRLLGFEIYRLHSFIEEEINCICSQVKIENRIGH